MRRAGRRRRRRHRARRSVLRSDGRRPGDPARVRARAGAGVSAARRARRSSRAFRQRERDDAGRADGLRQSDRGDGRGGVRRSRARRRRGRRASSSTIRPRKPPSSRRCCDARGIAPIFLLAPTTPEARIAARRGDCARGYVYYVSLKGVTGAGHLDTARRRAQARRDPPPCHACRSAWASAFAMPRARSAIAAHADAVVIGSRIIQEIEHGAPAEAAMARGCVARRRFARALDAREVAVHCMSDRRDERSMSWLQKLLPPRIKSTPGVRKTPVPEGLWVKCPSCEAVLYRTDLEKNLLVCPKCSYHNRVSCARAHRAAARSRRPLRDRLRGRAGRQPQVQGHRRSIRNASRPRSRKPARPTRWS